MHDSKWGKSCIFFRIEYLLTLRLLIVYSSVYYGEEIFLLYFILFYSKASAPPQTADLAGTTALRTSGRTSFSAVSIGTTFAIDPRRYPWRWRGSTTRRISMISLMLICRGPRCPIKVRPQRRIGCSWITRSNGLKGSRRGEPSLSSTCEARVCQPSRADMLQYLMMHWSQCWEVPYERWKGWKGWPCFDCGECQPNQSANGEAWGPLIQCDGVFVWHSHHVIVQWWLFAWLLSASLITTSIWISFDVFWVVHKKDVLYICGCNMHC